MRNREKEEQEAEKLRDKLFKKIRPMAPTRQVWRPKQKENASTSTSTVATPTPSEKDDAISVISSMTLVSTSSTEETFTPIYTLGDEEELIQEAIDINMVYYLPADFHAADEEGRVAQLKYYPSLWQEA